MVFDQSRPIYLQIAEDIQQKIISGVLREGEKLPSVREYCTVYDVTSITMQRAMAALEAAGATASRKGVGSFVVEGSAALLRSRLQKEAVQGFIVSMQNMGFGDADILEAVREELDNG